MKEVFLFPSPQSQSPQSRHPSLPHFIPGPGGAEGQGPEDGRNPQHWGMGLSKKVFQKTLDPIASPLSAFGSPSEPPLHSSEPWKEHSSGDCPPDSLRSPLPRQMSADTLELGRALDKPQLHCQASQTSASGPPALLFCERASVSLSVVSG